MFKNCNIAKSCLKVNIKHQKLHKSRLSIWYTHFPLGSTLSGSKPQKSRLFRRLSGWRTRRKR